MEHGNETTASGRTITFGDFFSGIGAMRLGFEQACKDAGLTPQCKGFSEVDPDAIGTYLRHFPGTPVLGDIVPLAASGHIPKCDVVLAGFPCQDASSAGKRLGLGGERGKLFFTLAEVIGVVHPSAFLLENVKGLSSLDGGKALKTILATLIGLGYAVRHAILHSRHFGVPQNRPRIYIVGFRDGGNEFAFPHPIDSTKRLKDILEESPVNGRYYVTERSLDRIRRHKARHKAAGNGFGARFLDAEHDVARTIKSSNWGREDNFVVDHRIGTYPITPLGKSPPNHEHVRRLTPLEWERLQGIPDGFTAGQADGHRYRQLGNAVTVPVIGAISGKLLSSLAASKSARPLTAVELCVGCGGLSTGLKLTGEIKVKVACEIDPAAAESYRLNNPGSVLVENSFATEETKREIVAALGGQQCDLLAAGLPCQSFSLSGKRNPDDPRGNLFEHFMDLLGRLSPKVAVIENVPGILSMRRPDGTLVIDAIAQAFKAHGYSTGYFLVNSADFGDPQTRKRIVIFGWREGSLPSFTKTHDEHGRNGLPCWRTVRDAIGDLEDAPANPETWHVFVNSRPEYVDRIRRTPVGQSAAEHFRESAFRNPPDVPSITVKANNGGVFVHYAKDRLVTPLELARLQSFPANYRFHGTKGEVLRQIGNAVPVGLATAIGKAVIGMLHAGVQAANKVTNEETGRPTNKEAA